MKQVLIFIILVIVCSCSTNPYKASNKSYKKQTKDYAKALAEYPLKDSITNSPYFVGTTISIFASQILSFSITPHKTVVNRH
jgi:N-acetylmuramoyl-L-alanine amidase